MSELDHKAGLFETVCEAVPDVILTCDSAGRIQTCNRAILSVFGHTKNEVPGLSLGQLLAQPYFREIEQLMLAFSAQSRAEDHKALETSRRILGVRKDGSAFPLSLNVSPFRFEGSLRFTLVIRDITRILDTELELERSNADLMQFASIVSHDLQAPLRTVSRFADSVLSREKARLGEDSVDRLRRIVAACERMRNLTTSLLDLSRINRSPPQLQPFPMSHVFGEVLQDLETNIVDTGARVTCSDPLPMVLGDKDRIRQLLQNLVGNALKFQSPGKQPEIHLSADHGEELHTFFLEDNGIGIQHDARERIFEAFQRLHTRDQYPGHGIGLALCKKIVESHGGTIAVRSGAGSGSCFYFTLRSG